MKQGIARSALTLTAAVAVGMSGAGPAAAQDKHYTIAFVPKLINIGYFNAMQQGGEEAAKKLGVTFVYNGPTTADANLQVQIVKQLIAQHVDALAVAPDDPAVVAPALTQAQAQGVKIFTSDTDAPASPRAVFVSQALDSAIGTSTLDSLADQMGGKGEWAIDSCGPAAQNLNNWIAIEKQRAQEKYPGMKLVGVVYSGEDQAKAVADSRDLITGHPDLRGIIGQCTTSAPGAAQAVTELHKIGKVFVTGVALPSGMKPYIENGASKSFVLWDPVKLGYLTVWAGAQLAAGKEFQAENDVPGLGKIAYDASKKILLLGPPITFTKANISQYKF